MECYNQYIWSRGVYQERVFSSRDVWQIFFSISLSTAERSRLWHGSEGRRFCPCPLSVMAEPGGHHAGREVQLPPISFTFCSYLANRNLAFLTPILSWKCIRDFFFFLTWMGPQGRVMSIAFSCWSIELNNFSFLPTSLKTHVILAMSSQSCISRVSAWNYLPRIFVAELMFSWWTAWFQW